MRKTIFFVIMSGLVICTMIVTGCIGTSPHSLVQKQPAAIPEPETGIARWILAVNDRNYGAVFDLLPASSHSGISRDQFIRFNQENPSPFLASEPVVTEYIIMKKNVSGLNATIMAGLRTTFAKPTNNESGRQETIFFTFDETFEDNEWKVWTRK